MITTHHRYTILAPSLVELRLRLEPIFWDCMTFQTFVIALCEWYIVIGALVLDKSVCNIYIYYICWMATAWMGPLLYKTCSHSRFLSVSVYRYDSYIAGLLALVLVLPLCWYSVRHRRDVLYGACCWCIYTRCTVGLVMACCAVVAVYRAKRNGDRGETRITFCSAHNDVAVLLLVQWSHPFIRHVCVFAAKNATTCLLLPFSSIQMDVCVRDGLNCSAVPVDHYHVVYTPFTSTSNSSFPFASHRFGEKEHLPKVLMTMIKELWAYPVSLNAYVYEYVLNHI